MSLDHPRNVLSGIVPGRRDHLMFAAQHLMDEHFAREQDRTIFQLLWRYYEITGGILTSVVLADMLRRQGVDVAKALFYSSLFEEMERSDVTDEVFRYSVDALKDLRAEQLTGEAITTSFEILQNGAEIDREVLQGHRDARAYLTQQSAQIDRLDAIEAAPEGDIRTEGDEVLKEYDDARAGRVNIGVRTGIPAFDAATGGFQRGELALVAGYTNVGKSQFCCQTAWHAATVQGVNVFLATSETLRTAMRRRIVARHSREERFNCPKGINSKDLRDGTLGPDEVKVLKEVVHDLEHNPNYGKIHVAQIPRGATFSHIETRVNREGGMWDVGLLMIDYLALIKADRKRQSEREELNDVLKMAKMFSTTYQDGRGLPLLSPWQMSQTSYREALHTGQYSLANLGDTVESERSSDTIISLLSFPEKKEEITAQFLKLRDDEVPGAVALSTDFRNAYFTDKAGLGGHYRHAFG